MSGIAPCGCPLVECEACGALVPRGETLFVPFGPGNLAGDVTVCAACTHAEPADVHPTCPTCGSCDECEHDYREACEVRPAFDLGERDADYAGDRLHDERNDARLEGRS